MHVHFWAQPDLRVPEQAQLQSYTRSPPGSSPFGALAVNGEVADQLGLESSSSSLGAHGTGLLDALPPAPSTQSTQSGSSAGDRCCTCHPALWSSAFGCQQADVSLHVFCCHDYLMPLSLLIWSLK